MAAALGKGGRAARSDGGTEIKRVATAIRDTGEDPASPGSGGSPLTRALRSHQLWLSLTYLGLLVLMARAYA